MPSEPQPSPSVRPTVLEEQVSLPTMSEEQVSLGTMSDAQASQRATTDHAPGLSGRFRILRPHAKGGLGQVSVALDQELHREVALKEILVHLSDDTNARERFVLEAEITGGLEHPGIVPVYALGQSDDGRPYYAMRFIKGDSLKQSIEQFHKADNPNLKDEGERQMALRQLLGRFIVVCNAMDYAHSRGVLHRDLKPGNIMVGEYGETLVVDWGLAKALGQREVGTDATPLRPSSALSSSVQTMQGSAIGTPAYMSPEQAAGKLDELGPTTDVYSLGATLYHLLCGRPPFEKEDLYEILKKVHRGEFPRPRSVLPTIPRGLEAICLKGMALRPEDRYPTARAMADDIEHWLADEPISAAEDSAVERLGRWARKHKSLVQAGSVSLLLITLITSIAYGFVSLSNKRLNLANNTISQQNTAITGKNDELKTTNVQLSVARTEAVRKGDEARELVREASRSDFATAQARLADGKWREAMAYLGRALRYDSDNVNARDALWLTLLHGQRDAPTLPRQSLRHKDAVLSASFSHDGTRVVTASRDQSARIWDVRTGQPIGAPLQHKGVVNNASFSPDGARVVTVSADTTAQLWDANTGEPVGPPLSHPDIVYGASFSPDGTRVVTAGGDATARSWDSKTVLPLGPPMKHQDAVYGASFSPDGSRIVTASGDTTARIWNAHTGEPVGSPLKHQDAVYGASFSPDGARVITASGDTTARIWDAGTGQPVSPPLKHERSVTSARFSPDGTRVITASDDKTARIWDAQTGEPVGPPLNHEGPVAGASFSPDGTRVVTAGEDQTARIWDVQTGLPIGPALNHEGLVGSASFSPDGTSVLTTSDDLTAGIWNAQTGQPIGLFLKHGDAVYDSSFSPDGTRVVTASGDTTARLWDAKTGEPIGSSLKHERSVTSARFSPDGMFLATASDDTTARVWNARTGEAISPPLNHTGVVIGASFSHDGTRVVTASHDSTSRIWDAQTGRPIGAPLKHENFVSSTSFSPDGTRVVTASRDKTARLWDAQTGQPIISSPMWHEDAVYFAGFSPDGTRMITASRDTTACLWNAMTGEQIPLPHPESVYIASFSLDGTHIITVSEDKTVRTWDAQTGQPFGPPLTHDSRVNSASFSPDGSRVLTANEDKTARIWDTRSSQPIGPPLRHAGSLNGAAFSPDGTRIVTANEDKSSRIWDVRSLEPLDGTAAETLVAFAAGARLDRRLGTLQLLSTEQRLASARGVPASLANNPNWLVLVEVCLAPRPESRILPRSTMTRREAATRLIRRRTAESLREAMLVDPGHPLIQIALAGLKAHAPQAEFLREYGVSRLSDDAAVCREAADMLKGQNDIPRATRALDKACRLEPNHPQGNRLLQMGVPRSRSFDVAVRGREG